MLCSVLSAEAQKVTGQKSYEDGTRVLTTTEVRFAKAGRLFSRSQALAMSYITFGEDQSSTYAIVIPLNIDHRATIPVGSRMRVYLENGEIITLLNVKNISQTDNRTEFDRTFTVRPEFSVSEEQLKVLEELPVNQMRIETDSDFIDILKENYPREWIFNRMLLQCHNVLQWKLSEKEF